MSNIGTALITGASSGIGLELARIHAANGGNLVLVARSADKLHTLQQQLQSEHHIHVEVIAMDLAQPGAAQRIHQATEAAGIEVQLLINNAGFGGHGLFHQRRLGSEQAMIAVNIGALTELTHAYLPAMVARRRGRVLNVSSTASFMPGPLQAVYYATKAYVTSFSQALAEEVREFGVSVTALCPGAVATGFVQASDLSGVALFDQARSAESVAQCGYEAMQAGKLVAFNESRLRLLLEWIVPLMPRAMLLKTSRQAMEKSSNG